MKTKIQRLFQTITGPVIFKLLLLASFFLFSFTPEGTEKSNVPVIRKELTLVSPFQKIIINGDISVMLTNKPAGTVLVEGDENEVSNLRYRTKNNELIINAGKKKRSTQLSVYLSAGMLKNMLINGDGDISSTGTVQTNNLYIWLNGNVNVKINVIGEVSVDAFDSYDQVWEPLSMKKSK
jgi:Putative auto-transporter adhesin, head GIN domain